MTRLRSRRRPLWNLVVVSVLIVVAVVSMLVYSALSRDPLPSEENQPEQEEVVVDPVVPNPTRTPEEAGAPEDQQQPEE